MLSHILASLSREADSEELNTQGLACVVKLVDKHEIIRADLVHQGQKINKNSFILSAKKRLHESIN